jgi:hypothetical protein
VDLEVFRRCGVDERRWASIKQALKEGGIPGGMTLEVRGVHPKEFD